MESNTKDDVHKAANKCAAQFNITMSQLNKCMSSKLGNDLEHAMALRTDALIPAHKYVPWVTLNGEHTEDIQQQAQTDLVALICNAYKVCIKKIK
jgi:interferon gamma-inducible protein 30